MSLLTVPVYEEDIKTDYYLSRHVTVISLMQNFFQSSFPEIKSIHR
jgi:hypothetical protein